MLKKSLPLKVTKTQGHLTHHQMTKFKAFADNNINVTEKLKSVMGRVEHIVGKGENASYQHFLLFP